MIYIIFPVYPFIVCILVYEVMGQSAATNSAMLNFINIIIPAEPLMKFIWRSLYCGFVSVIETEKPTQQIVD